MVGSSNKGCNFTYSLCLCDHDKKGHFHDHVLLRVQREVLLRSLTQDLGPKWTYVGLCFHRPARNCLVMGWVNTKMSLTNLWKMVMADRWTLMELMESLASLSSIKYSNMEGIGKVCGCRLC